MLIGQLSLWLNSTQLELMCILYPTPPNPTNIVPETQEISGSNSASNNPEEDFIDVDTIPETQNFSNATGKYQPLRYLINT